MESREARWFLAHRRQDDDNDINYWCKCLADMLTSCPEWQAKVIPGRDDYEMRASAIGGWKTWCRDVPCGSRYDGEPMFHGVIVPADSHIEALSSVRQRLRWSAAFLTRGNTPSCGAHRAMCSGVSSLLRRRKKTTGKRGHHLFLQMRLDTLTCRG